MSGAVDPKRRLLLGGLLAAAASPGLAMGDDTSTDPRLPPVPSAPLHAAVRSTRSGDGTHLHYVTGGSGPVALVFVHGWSCNHRFFWPQLAAAATTHRFAALDLAGHGDSERRRSAISVAAFADDAEAVIRAEFPAGPLVLVVHSTGGRVACALAGRLGSRLIGIIGIDTFQNLGLPLPTDAVIAARLASQRADFIGDTRRHVQGFFPPGADPTLVEWVSRQMISTDAATAIAASEAFARFDARAAIAGWPRRVVALNSDLFPTDYRRIREVLPEFDLLLLAGRGHFPNLDDPATFNPLLLATVQRIIAERPSPPGPA